VRDSSSRYEQKLYFQPFRGSFLRVAFQFNTYNTDSEFSGKFSFYVLNPSFTCVQHHTQISFPNFTNTLESESEITSKSESQKFVSSNK
jgi:hypothetical protein